ncbi:MAG: uracil phosphoribosyltransferase [Bacteroidales bacterium]|jgi:uracil phosphoribosyltransferase|nr:uracil phosphoribosyltransferase [Bacteroidales bacterium]HOL97821.1 uracil phosphoribosyltransferase [Bacteroidales bacterium]HOM35870.1 uracil phosphoribosyltransferase [Bacteroidales bacterium]HPD23211.1 uracil phosphoribosyltransferase [Bacteroidales bacterium]HRS99215.1 uracil phosphoribosyltransferase [Bacteroidales bacterium]
MKVINLGGKGTLLDQFVAELRDHQIQLDRLRFRLNLERIGEIMAYEISKSLPFVDEEVTTPLGIATVPCLKEQPVIATLMRAGVPYHQGFLNYFDHADSAFIAGYRKYDKSGEFEIKIDYVSSPEIEKKIVIINDPMLASGGSFELAYKTLLAYGKPRQTHMAAIIASKEGLDYLERKLINVNINVWVAAIDDELTVKSYIVPGLGDAGDLAYGKKIDN